jgi:hypothetical protein
VPLQRLQFTQNFADKDGNKLAPASIGLPGSSSGRALVVTFQALRITAPS